MDATQPPDDPGPIVTSSNNQSSGKGKKDRGSQEKPFLWGVENDDVVYKATRLLLPGSCEKGLSPNEFYFGSTT